MRPGHLFLGLGETDEEVLQAMKDLKSVGCVVVTFGQYLQPAKRHLKVVEFITPEKFNHWADVDKQMDFLYCDIGPLVRSSYKAAEYY